MVTLAALTVGCGVFLAATWRHGKAEPAKPPTEPARQVVNFEPANTDPVAPTLANPGPTAPSLTGEPAAQTNGQALGAAPPATTAAQAQARAQAVAQHAAEVQAIRSAPILVFGAGAGGAANPGAVLAPIVPAIRTATEGGTELDKLRQGSTIGLAHASRLPDRNFLIVAGATLPCLLQTAMGTATPGYVSCLIPKDIYSDNGAVVLMEKGTKVLGEYRSGLRQGQNRLFVLWTRAVTPAGVAINLASPAADSLGRAGFDGALDSFFWQRFGGALLLSIVDDAVTAAGAHGNTGTINTVPGDAAGIALQNSINIPPVLRKPQGSEVSIFVAQDFDFSGVYALKARTP
jgi:type IV secretion system protein VirB10